MKEMGKMNNSQGGDQYKRNKRAFDRTIIHHMPKQKIATFGETMYTYYFIAKTKKRLTRIIEGSIQIKTPLIVTPYFSSKETFQNMDEQAVDFAEELLQQIDFPMTFIEYRFQNVDRESWVEPYDFSEALIRMGQFFDKDKQKNSILLSGEEETWNVSLIKSCMKIIEMSMRTNLTEIEERGLLDENGIPKSLEKDIEKMFQTVKTDKSKKNIRALGNLLIKYDLFDHYEERFFDLIKVK